MTNADLEISDVRLERTLIDQIWMKEYRKIEAFENENGHSNISFYYKDDVLVRWMAKQRGLQHKGKLRQDREKVLHDIGFVWIKNEDDDEMQRTASNPNQATKACLTDFYAIENKAASFRGTEIPLTQCDKGISPAMLQCDDDGDEHILADDGTKLTVPWHKTRDVSSERLTHIEVNEIALDAKAPSETMLQRDDQAKVPMIDIAKHNEPRHYSSNLPCKRLATHERNEMAFEAGVPTAPMMQYDDPRRNHEHAVLATIEVAEHDTQYEKSNSASSAHSAHKESNLKSIGTASTVVALGGESSNVHRELSLNVPPEHLPHNKENEKASRAASLPNAMEVQTAKTVSTHVRPFIPEMAQHVPRKRPRKGTPYSLSVYRNRS
ncbi:hypothetical protein FisN_2Lh602 [Fistulifera solaris]|uniref:Helicase-associated domain-containing protein n=1 Tax=Fistulifera solaris TaxID=1519565 RepID=A0A1Z5JAQ2_FISSO|nr:hypothetical protein FisN_2Lh602 [Fistulifera solaris]|eukprot:GAX11067.1 hypothetical protein FisN_2Lh602 [Fistulifera solaris]